MIEGKFVKMAALGVFLVFSSVLGVYYTMKMGKRLPKSIIYDF
jgi:hypothetical protein